MPPSEQARWFAEEVQPHEPALRGYLRSQFPSVDDDDVVQESYLKLLRLRTTVRIASTKAYLFSVARNTAHNIFRRRKLFSDVPVNELPDSAVFQTGCTAPDIANTHQRWELTAAAIDELPIRCRQVVEFAVLDGLSTAEIATRMGLAEPTVRVQLARGIAKCAAYMRARGEAR